MRNHEPTPTVGCFCDACIAATHDAYRKAELDREADRLYREQIMPRLLAGDEFNGAARVREAELSKPNSGLGRSQARPWTSRLAELMANLPESDGICHDENCADHWALETLYGVPVRYNPEEPERPTVLDTSLECWRKRHGWRENHAENPHA